MSQTPRPTRRDPLLDLLDGLEPEEIAALVNDLPEHAVAALLEVMDGAGSHGPSTPLETALTLDEGYREREHLRYVSDRLAAAVRDVERGRSRKVIIEMPPRSGKSTLTTQYAPLWMLRQHPEWSFVLTSHDPSLATSWGRQIRRWVEEGKAGPGVSIASDAGAVQEWETTQGGSVVSRSLRGSLTGRGAKVLLIDDPHKDMVEAHSAAERDRIWRWWLAVAQTRLEPPSLVIVIMTRWHEDDLVGRLLSKEHEGDPADWERIRLPAIAEPPTEQYGPDVLGREEGEPLISPLVDETPEEALARWEETKRNVGSYTYGALFQQRPSPASGTIFNVGWWRYWTTDPSKATDDGRVVYFDPAEHRSDGRWVESWDCTFKGTEGSDYVVGQRWVRVGPNRFLVAQDRARRTFTGTLAAMRAFSAAWVRTRLVEDKANGTAVIDTMKREVDGIVPVTPRDGKEARARAVTPEVEAGNVLLPHPTDEGNEWVTDLLSEFRDFPAGAHDDQVDATTQALTRLRSHQAATVSNPNRAGKTVPERARTGSARTSASARSQARTRAVVRGLGR